MATSIPKYSPPDLTGGTCWKCALVMLLCSFCLVYGDEYRTYSEPFPPEYTPVINITYKDPKSGEPVWERETKVQFGTSSRKEPESGWVVRVRDQDNKTDGCLPPVNVPSNTKWIALIQRGSCKFTEKINNAAVVKNASAVVVYDNQNGELIKMEHSVSDVVSIFMDREIGERIAELLDNGTKVFMQITLGPGDPQNHPGINKTSVLFVSISFIVLMIISLAWLVFYYIQRFRYAHAKERLSRRLLHAAKKAVTKMPSRTVKHGDKETEADFDQCAVCIEGYSSCDVIRILPCKHVFHKSCVDPWLIEHRSCPMCKMDILKAYGLQVHDSRESCINIDLEGASTSISPSELIQAEQPIREFDCDGVEVVHFQPSQIEFHSRRHSSPVNTDEIEDLGSLDESSGAIGGCTYTLPDSGSSPDTGDIISCRSRLMSLSSQDTGRHIVDLEVVPETQQLIVDSEPTSSSEDTNMS